MKNIFISAVSMIGAMTMAANAQQSCTGPDLHALLETDLSSLNKVKQEAAFARAMGGADVHAYYQGDDIKAVTARFESDAAVADMNFYIKNKTDYLMEYHIVQNSNFYAEADSVVLTDEKSYYHVCDGKLLAPAIGGIIKDDVYENMKLVLDVILTEASK
ncbi:hypothetical protein [Pseudemcibacter aquimaris]|uniref:hypothetical protein n=1 Tax=Pseudemcibacter aquimaris TaxID=2857064 RepID=UPI002012B250|nr:hypothetical protein [Pseudemcibacter aquimaris]MCC3859610.1 hypothetical protein [Pseudemcibacter aquimaris]WDU60005.1 hypothetical protein KW060_07015 [Pseudemcibacter aquimaris]